MRSSPPLAAALIASVLALACAGGSACAASLAVHVATPAGKALGGAVVLLEADGARPPVRPMPVAQLAQRNRQFQPQVTVITVGTPVNFPNEDTVRHHVYSFSAAKTFELKLYAGTPHEPIVFDKPGIVTLGCNIHDQMVAWIVVADTPWHERSAADGTVRFAEVPPGRYHVVAWHPDLPDNAPPASAAVALEATDVQRDLVLAVASR